VKFLNGQAADVRDLPDRTIDTMEFSNAPIQPLSKHEDKEVAEPLSSAPFVCDQSPPPMETMDRCCFTSCGLLWDPALERLLGYPIQK
jgi:hypothetical protein